MKKENFALLCLMLSSIVLFAQKEQIILTFSGTNSNNQTVILDSVLVENITQALNKTVYYPDLSITLEYETGIEENSRDIFKGSLVYPNPFDNYSILSVNNPEKQEVSISIVDNTGRVIIETSRLLLNGIHNFRLNPSIAGALNIVISNGEQKSVLNAISLNYDNSSNTTLEYAGQGVINETGLKTTYTFTSLPYQQGDVLRFTGYAAGYPNVSIIDSPTANKNYQLEFSGGGGSGTFTDPRDNQTYNTVEIGSQEWFAENLNYETTDSWWYDNSSAYGDVYGRLYTWDAALTACPSGWSLPSDYRWKQMEMALGMSQSEADDTGWRGTDEGGKMKETGTTHWRTPNTDATNSSGFSALPGGYRSTIGGFYDLHYLSRWWSATEYLSDGVWTRGLGYDNAKVHRSYGDKGYGLSVRCVRD